jgi:hypothetical protein
MPGSQTTPGPTGARSNAPADFAFRQVNNVGTRGVWSDDEIAPQYGMEEWLRRVSNKRMTPNKRAKCRQTRSLIPSKLGQVRHEFPPLSKAAPHGGDGRYGSI